MLGHVASLVIRSLVLGITYGALLGAFAGIVVVLVYLHNSDSEVMVMSMLASSVFYAIHGALLGSFCGLAVGLVRRKMRRNADQPSA